MLHGVTLYEWLNSLRAVRAKGQARGSKDDDLQKTITLTSR